MDYCALKLCEFISLNSIWQQLRFMAIISVVLNGHLICLVQMARNTRSGHNEVPPPPPPPPPMPTELLAALVEGQRMLNEAMQTMAQQNRGGRHVRQGGEANQHSGFKDFQDTKPPLFKEAVEPLEADEWLNTLEQKFRLLRVTEELKAEYAAHQMEGKAGV